MPEIEVLDVTPIGYYAGGQPYYNFGCSFPWLKALETGYHTKQEAYADAVKWVRNYETQDPYGNMGAALGVTEKDGKFFGVVNYFHSNT